MNIDTVAAVFEMKVNVTPNWDNATKHRKGKFLIIYYYNLPLQNGAAIMITYMPFGFVGKPWLKVECSLPHVVNGDNVSLDYDIDSAIDLVNQALTQVPGLPRLDLRNGVLVRLDGCYNHFVGDLVPYYVKALQALDFPYRTTKPFSNHGVQFKSKRSTVKFYDKYKECGLPQARGILRQEVTLRREAIKKLTCLRKPTIKDITPQLLAKALKNDLQKLGLLGRSIGTKDSTLECFRKVAGELASYFYYGLLHAKTYLTQEMILSATNTHPRSLNRRLKIILETGTPLVLTETIDPLPPLTIIINVSGKP